MFVDQAECLVRAGDGGRGAVAFRREKYVPLGGPSGGDGGRGGDVLLVGDTQLATLLSFKHRRELRAGGGEPGGSQNRHGRDGASLRVPVPLGTVARDADTGAWIGELLADGQEVCAAAGGRGGRGNARFRSSTRQAPRFAERGEAGAVVRLELELRVLADVGLLGMPNAGKSTLLAAVSAARPRIAPYPFTTLEPQLGVVRREDREMVLADIPGLVEGAHTGRGLGNAFLRHVERCRLLVHVVDGAGSEGRDPVADFRLIEAELRLRDPELAARPRVLVANKSDLPAWEAHWPALQALGNELLGVFALSAATGRGTDELVRFLLAQVARLPRRGQAPPEDEAPVVIRAPRRMTVRGGDGEWEVRDPGLERLVAMADLENPEALDYLLGQMLRAGLPARLRQAGAAPGDVLRIGEWGGRVGEGGVPLAGEEAEEIAGGAAEDSDDADGEL